MQWGWLRSKKFWLGLAGAGSIALLSQVLPLQDWVVKIHTWLETLGPWAVPAFIMLYVLTSIIAFPNIILILVAGTVFGLAKGIISASIADTLAAVACFLLGRTIIRKRIKEWMQHHPNFAKFDQAVGEKGWKILVLSRLSPMVPSNLLNYGFSCTQVNFWQYFFFTWIGMLPVIGFYVYLGTFGMKLVGANSSPQALTVQGIGLVATIIAAVYITRLAQKTLFTSD